MVVSTIGCLLDSCADNMGSSPGNNILFVQTLPAFYSVWIYWEIKGVSISYHVYVVGDVKEIGSRVSVYFIIIIIIRLYIAINYLMGRKPVFNHSINVPSLLH